VHAFDELTNGLPAVPDTVSTDTLYPLLHDVTLQFGALFVGVVAAPDPFEISQTVSRHMA
jgi:hypothetical protein